GTVRIFWQTGQRTRLPASSSRTWSGLPHSHVITIGIGWSPQRGRVASPPRIPSRPPRGKPYEKDASPPRPWHNSLIPPPPPLRRAGGGGGGGGGGPEY